jgi:hypothetical protein
VPAVRQVPRRRHEDIAVSEDLRLLSIEVR